ncbi:MAG: hypothetical protein ACSNEK_04065 [Parachlamydiaceae bacterium]
MHNATTLKLTIGMQDSIYTLLNNLSIERKMLVQLASFPIALMDVSVITSSIFLSAIEELIRSMAQFAKVACRARGASLKKVSEHAKTAGVLTGLAGIALLCSSVCVGIQTLRICKNPTFVRSIIYLKY